MNEAHAKGDFDGAVIISEGGKVVFNVSVGVAPQTVFRLASLTKQVTSLLIMQEVTAGHITLDQKAGEGLPNVSIRQLLQHISGLPNPSDGPDNVIPAYYLRTGASAADITANAKGLLFRHSQARARRQFRIQQLRLHRARCRSRTNHRQEVRAVSPGPYHYAASSGQLGHVAGRFRQSSEGCAAHRE